MANINYQNVLGQTALMTEILQKSSNIHKLLDNNNNLNLDIKDFRGNTALMVALNSSADNEVINKLLDKKFNINIQNDSGQTVLMVALSNIKINQDIINKLLDKKPDLNLQDNNGNTVLMVALELMHHKYKLAPKYFDKILNTDKLKINTQNVYGMTALMNSLKMNIDKVSINKIIDKKADVNLKEYNENTALYYALNNLEKDNLTNEDKTNNSCELTSFKEWCSIILRIIEYIDINIQDRYGNTPLMLLIHFNTPIHLINYMLNKKNLDFNKCDNDGNNVLMVAISKLYELSNDEKFKLSKIILQLIQQSLINTQNNEGNSAAMLALNSFDDVYPVHNIYINEILNEMSKFDLDVNIQNKHGETPLMLCLNINNKSIIIDKILNDKNLDVNTIDNYRRNVLHRLLIYYKADNEDYYISDIIKRGIDINAQDSKKNTALYYAIKFNRSVYIINQLMREDPLIKDKDITNKVKYDNWVDKWIKYGNEKDYFKLDTDIENHIKQKNAIVSDGMTIYRGLRWNNNGIKDNLSYIITNISNLSKYKYINIKLKELSSWTADYNVAKEFSYGELKLILSMKVNKDDILLDDFNRPEQEIIVKPNKYKCKIEYTNITNNINKEVSIDD
jgi:ankyrin repeat protein